MLTRPLLLLFPLLILSIPFLVACGSVSGLTGGKPSTSAPGASEPNEHYALCAERADAIDDWERRQARKIEDEWIDQKRGLLQSGAKFQRVQEEAREMRLDLQDNCNDAYMEKWGPK